MLYDPKWEKQTRRKQRGWLSRLIWPLKAREVYDRTDFMVWVACQPPQKKYDYTHPMECALAQYLQARGISQYGSMVDPWKIDPTIHVPLNPGGGGFTFGELSERLKSHR